MAGVKLLSDSNIFKAAVAQLQASIPVVAASVISNNVPTVIPAYFDTLPNEANGDPIPTSGLYVSGQGIIKVA